MTTFNNQHMVNSMDEQVDDGFFDIKSFISEVFPALSSCNSSSMPNQIPQNTMNGKVEEVNITNLSSLYPAAVSNQKGSAAISSPQLISFRKSSPSLEDFETDYGNDMDYSKPSPMRRDPIQAQYHVEAERKRRERLNDLFISLSKVVPGLKRLDKASVLGDAIKQIKALQERMKTLEEEVKKDSAASEADAMGERCIISTCNHCTSSFKHNIDNSSKVQLPDVKVKILGKNVLIKILCDKRYKGYISSMSSELEKLHLGILDTRILKFGCSALDISIKAKMETEFSATVKDIIEHLQIALFQVHS